MGSPLPVGLKNAVPANKSNDSKIKAAAKTGVAIKVSAEVAIIAQQNKGISLRPMLGTRMVKMVTAKFTAPKIEEVPRIKTLRIQISSPA